MNLSSYFRVTRETIGNVRQSIIAFRQPKWSSRQAYCFQRLLNEIDEGGLIMVANYLKTRRSWYLSRKKINNCYILFEDLLILFLYKVNQFQLCKRSVCMINKKLCYLIRRPLQSVRIRLIALNRANFDIIKAAMLKDFDILLYHTDKTINRWVSSKNKYKKSHKSNYQIIQLKNSKYVIVIAQNHYTNQTSFIKRQQDKQEDFPLQQQLSLKLCTNQEFQNIKLVFQRIEQNQLKRQIQNSIKKNNYQTQFSYEDQFFQRQQSQLKLLQMKTINDQIKIKKFENQSLSFSTIQEKYQKGYLEKLQEQPQFSPIDRSYESNSNSVSYSMKNECNPQYLKVSQVFFQNQANYSLQKQLELLIQFYQHLGLLSNSKFLDKQFLYWQNSKAKLQVILLRRTIDKCRYLTFKKHINTEQANQIKSFINILQKIGDLQIQKRQKRVQKKQIMIAQNGTKLKQIENQFIKCNLIQEKKIQENTFNYESNELMKIKIQHFEQRYQIDDRNYKKFDQIYKMMAELKQR